MLSVNRIITFVMVIGFFAASANAQSLSGQWRVSNGTLHGNPVPTAVLNAMALNLTAATFSATSQGMNSTGDFTTNTTVSPNQAVFKIGQGNDNGRELKAIYQFTGQNLLITFSETAQFPTGFQSNGTNRYLALTYSKGAAGAGGNVAGAANGGQAIRQPTNDRAGSGSGVAGPDD